MLGWLIGILGLGGATTAAAIVFPPFGALLALAGKAAVGWLSKRSLGEIVGIVLAVLLAIDHLALLAAHRENAKLETQLSSALKARDGYKAQLDSLSTKKNRQAVITKTNIVTVTKTIQAADDKAKKIETAPLPGKCRTPTEILGADL